jgi:hypothetical protein
VEVLFDLAPGFLERDVPFDAARADLAHARRDGPLEPGLSWPWAERT